MFSLKHKIDIAPLLFGLAILAIPLLFPCRIAMASESDSGWGILESIGKIVNLGVVVGILVYALKKPLVQYFDDRRKGILREIEEAKNARLAAESKLAEMEKRMAQLDSELGEMREKAQIEAAEERTRLLSQADKEAAALLENARKEVDALLRGGRMELKTFASQLAVELAAEKIRSSMDNVTQQRLVDNFTEKLNKLS